MKYSASSQHRQPAKKDSRLSVFLGFFLAACVLGLGVRLYFAPERITPWLRTEVSLHLPQVGINFKSAELLLSHGVFPSLSLEIYDIEIQSKDSCEERIPPIRIGRAILPIDFFKLIRGQLALSEVSVQKIEMDIENFQNNCAAKSSSSSSGSASALKNSDPEASGQKPAVVAGSLASSVPLASPASSASPAPTLPPTSTSAAPQATANSSDGSNLSFWDEKKISQIDNFIAGAEFDEIKFYFDHHQKYFLLKNFNLRQSKNPGSTSGSYKLKSEFLMPQEYLQGESLPSAVILADLSAKKIMLEISSQVSEGRLLLTAFIVPGSHSPMIDLKVEAKQLPVSSFANYLMKTNVLPVGFQPKFIWLSFLAAIKGRLDQLKALPIEFRDVLLDGEFGQAKIAHAVRNPDASLSEFIVDLTKIDVQKSLDLFSVKGPDGIFSKFGDFRGVLDVKTFKNFSLRGDWQNSALKFSRHGNRTEQKIDKLKIELALIENKWRGKISDIELEKGKFSGGVDLAFDSSFEDGEINISSEDIEFDSAVQRSMFLGSMAGIAIKGKFIVSKSLVKSWEGEMQARSLDSEELNFKRATIKSRYNNNRLTLLLKIAEGEYKYNPKIKAWVKKLLFNFQDPNDFVIFTNLNAEITEVDNNWIWKNLKMSLLAGQVQLLSSGELTSHEDLSADLNLDFPKAKRLSWKLAGSLINPDFMPVSNNLKSLIGKNADYKVLGLNPRE